MKLTGKCKQEFKDWFYREYSSSVLWDMWIHDEIPSPMQWGVYQDYFDSVGIYSMIEPLYDMQGTNRVSLYGSGHGVVNIQCQNRQTVRTAAIKKANEIRNKQLKL